MPRRASVSDAESIVPSAPRVARSRRKRADENSSEVLTVPRTADAEEAVATETPLTRPRRKAPTRRVVAPATEDVRVSETPSKSVARRPDRSRLSLVLMSVFFLSAVGVSALLGFADKGTIDVAAKLQEQGQIQANLAGEQAGTASQVVPVQTTPVEIPNGVLRGMGIDSGQPPPPPPLATSTATSTTDVATSTAETTETTETESTDTAGTETETSPPTAPEGGA
jgi:hypothetical protein